MPSRTPSGRPSQQSQCRLSHHPRLRLEALTESRDTSRHNRAFIAFVNQPNLAPHLINVQISSPVPSPLFLPDPVLLIAHHVPVPPTYDAVSPSQESPAAPDRRLTPSPRANPAPYLPSHHTASSARTSPLALSLDTACGAAASAPFPQQGCSYDSANSDDDMGPPLPSVSSSVLRERYFPSEEEAGEGERPRRPSEHDLRGLIPGEPSIKPGTPLYEQGGETMRSVPCKLLAEST